MRGTGGSCCVRSVLGAGSVAGVASSLAIAALLHATPALAQQRPVPDSTAFEKPPGVPSAGGALIRSLIVPGWGQVASHAYIRGAVYFLADGGSWYMLTKTLHNLHEAQDREARYRRTLQDSLLTLLDREARFPRLVDPRLPALQDSIEADTLVSGATALVESRKNQRQDWVAQVIFWTLASAADAFVTAELADFPGRVSIAPRPDGGVALGYSLPVRRPW